MNYINPCLQAPWNIPEKQEQYLTPKIERTLSFLNRNCKGNFYMIDFYRHRLFSSSTSIMNLSANAKNDILKKGLDLCLQDVKSEEKKWLHKFNEELHRIFYKYNERERLNLEIFYELTGKTLNRKEIILRHKITPFELCENGNLWLALCVVTESMTALRSDKATLLNFETGDKYEFNGTTFIESGDKIVNSEEIAILKCLSAGMLEKEISDKLQIPKSSLGRKKQVIFAKLGAKTAAEATFLARSIEII